MNPFKKQRYIPGVATIDLKLVAFNVSEDVVEYAVAILVDTIRTTIYMDTGGIVEEF